MKWFTIWWYKYLFAKRTWLGKDIPFYKVLWCRLKNHPSGVTWYNPNGLEPDMHCKNCGDDLG